MGGNCKSMKDIRGNYITVKHNIADNCNSVKHNLGGNSMAMKKNSLSTRTNLSQKINVTTMPIKRSVTSKYMDITCHYHLHREIHHCTKYDNNANSSGCQAVLIFVTVILSTKHLIDIKLPKNL